MVPPLRLFIVEDSRIIADALSELLAVDGTCMTVARASTEAGALTWSFQNDAGFDVAIVDLILAEGSGFAVLSHFAKYQPGKVVVLSEFVTPAIADRCKSLGAAAAFPKSRIADCVEFIHGLAARS
jgi:DNA-binding NarL/FixJ family response regulator